MYYRAVYFKLTEISVEHFNVRFKEQPKQNSMKQAATEALLSCLAYFLTPKMEAIYFSEISVDVQRDTRPYIPEDRTIYNNHCLGGITNFKMTFVNWKKICHIHKSRNISSNAIFGTGDNKPIT
jgi:hypothetical protein